MSNELLKQEIERAMDNCAVAEGVEELYDSLSWQPCKSLQRI